MGSVTVIFLPILLPFMLLMSFFGNFLETTFGINVTEVALPYNEETGLVWECEKNDYGWFELTDTRVEGDTQVFVFEAEAVNGDCDKVVFTAKNGEELVYYSRDVGSVFSLYGKVELYAPDEYIIYDYVPVPETKVENAYWSASSQYDDYLLAETYVDGELVIRIICFDDVPFSYHFSYIGKDPEGDGLVAHERIEAEFKYTKEDGLHIEETRQSYYSQNDQ